MANIKDQLINGAVFNIAWDTKVGEDFLHDYQIIKFPSTSFWLKNVEDKQLCVAFIREFTDIGFHWGKWVLDQEARGFVKYSDCILKPKP